MKRVILRALIAVVLLAYAAVNPSLATHNSGAPHGTLKQNGSQESTFAALITAAPAVAPSELVFEDLVLVKKAFWRKSRTGRLVMRSDTLVWEAQGNPNDNFTFQIAGLEKVWFTCEARSSGNFCHEINFKIVRGDSYRFRDSGRSSGSNAAVLKVMEALRTNFPRLNFSTPSVSD